ncbi:unnamed protein product [Musa textilis]
MAANKLSLSLLVQCTPTCSHHQLLCFLGLCWVNHQTVDLKVKMDCDGCERRVKHAVSSIRGVTNVNVNRNQSMVTVTGHIEAKEVVRKIKGTGKRAEAWPYVPYSLVRILTPPAPTTRRLQPASFGTWRRRWRAPLRRRRRFRRSSAMRTRTHAL